MRVLAFSDVHRDLRHGRRLARRAREVDVVVAAGDFASVHRGLDELTTCWRGSRRRPS
jgi:predicted phosphodiesterase